MEPTSRLAAYVAELPDGFRSHASCQVKASICRHMLASSDLTAAPEGVPQELRDFLAAPPVVSAWVPEVFLMGLLLAVADRTGDDDAFLAWMRKANHSLLTTPWYGVLMRVASPALLLKGTELRWGTLHRGTRVAVVRDDAHRVTLRFEFPARLYTQLLLRGYGTAFAAAIEVAGGRDATAVLRRVTPTTAEYEGTWR